MKQGSIPENLRFHVRGVSKVRFRWEDMEEAQQESKVYDVYPTYVADAANKKTNETGVKWANEAPYQLDPASGKWVKGKSNATTVDRPNDPIKSVKIMDLEIRGQGGRAYKVLIDEKYYVDLREDVLLDVIFECGIEKGGKLKGEFIFAVVGSQMKLVRVGSLLHDKLIESTAVGKMKEIKQFVVGTTYVRKSGSYVYLGVYNSRKILGEEKVTNTGGGYSYRDKRTTVVTGKGPVEQYHLFAREDFVKGGKSDFCTYYALIVKKPSSFKSVGAEYDIADKIPKWMATLRKTCGGYFTSEQSQGYYGESMIHGEYCIAANLSAESDYTNPVFGI